VWGPAGSSSRAQCFIHRRGDACLPRAPEHLQQHLPCPPSVQDFYGHYDAQDFAKAHARELGMKTVPSLNVVYTEEKG